MQKKKDSFRRDSSIDMFLLLVVVWSVAAGWFINDLFAGTPPALDQLTEPVVETAPEARAVQVIDHGESVYIRVNLSPWDNYSTAQAIFYGGEGFTYRTDDQVVRCSETESICFVEYWISGMVSDEYYVELKIVDQLGYEIWIDTYPIERWGNITETANR